MVKIAPSILNAPPLELGSALMALREADWIHLDMMDGHFVPNLTFGPWLAGAVVAATDLPVEAHLMVANPGDHLPALREAGCRRVYIHAEATAHIHRILAQASDLGLEAGVALNPGTPAGTVAAVAPEVDAVLVMSVDPGWGGQAFWAGALAKVRAVRQLGFKGVIEVDGGIDPTTATAVAEAGADLLVVGSYLFREGVRPEDQLRRVRASLGA